MTTDTPGTPDVMRTWHEIVRDRDPVRLGELLAPDVTFHSPVLHRPQQGRDLTQMYLTGAMHVLVNDTFRYVREIVGETDAALEFEATVDDVHVNGVDLITWDSSGRITDFKVMVRPIRAVTHLQRRMAELLESMAQ